MSKTIIYQVFTRLYGNRCTMRRENGNMLENGTGKFNDFDMAALKEIKAKGVSHVWYTGVIRHATQTDYSRYGIPRQHPAIVKGKAGSPYAITDYYDVDPDLAVDVEKRMEEFEALVKRTHKAGLKMVIDFVPNHVARQYQSICKPMGVEDLGEKDIISDGFYPHNNFYYCPGHLFEPHFDLRKDEAEPYQEYPAKATGNDCFCHQPGVNDWYETVKLNYGVDYYAGRICHFEPTPSTWLKMVDILLFWAAKGIDAFRCDMAEMVPAEFWSYATKRVKEQYPEILFIGEVYNPHEYRHYIASGFDLLYDKVGMYDTMRAVTRGEYPATYITYAWQKTDDIRDHMLYFLENHDEQRIGSRFFAGSGTKGVPAMVASVLMQRNAFMLYAGQEYGERALDKEGFSGDDGRTTIFDYWSIDTLCRAAWGTLTDEEQALARIYNKVLTIAQKEKAIGEGAFFDLMYVNHRHDVYSFLRKAESELLIVAANFSDADTEADITLPAHAFDHLGLPEKTLTATDLISSDKQKMKLKRDCTVGMTIPAWGARVWKIRLPKQ